MSAQIHIATMDSELENILDLRYKVLRAPWNKSRESATDEFESEAINAYIKDKDSKIIACGRLHQLQEKKAQIRYMAVDPLHQNKGLGAQILKQLEEEARLRNWVQIELQARENALDFYTSQGYHIIEKSFLLWDIIQHYRMGKDLGK